MKEKYLNLLKQSYYNLTQKDEDAFREIIRDDGLGKCKPKFNLWAFLFGWFYLLYRRMSMEAFGVLIFSLMIGYLLAYAKIHPLLVLLIMIGVNSLLSGFCYYFLYLNKFNKDVEYCGEFNTDIECLKKRSKPKIFNVVLALIVILIMIWPWIYALITGAKLK
jgi:hypothetical protein